MQTFRKILASKSAVFAVRFIWVASGIALAISMALDVSSDMEQRVLLVLVAALAIWFGVAAGPHPLMKMTLRRGEDGE